MRRRKCLEIEFGSLLVGTISLMAQAFEAATEAAK